MKSIVTATLCVLCLGHLTIAENKGPLPGENVSVSIARLRAHYEALYRANEAALKRELQKVDVPYLEALAKLEIIFANSKDSYELASVRAERKRISEGRMLNPEISLTLEAVFGRTFTNYFSAWKKVVPLPLANWKATPGMHLAALEQLQSSLIVSGDLISARAVMNERHRVAEEILGSKGSFRMARKWLCGTELRSPRPRQSVWNSATTDLGFAIVTGVGFLQSNQNPDGSLGERNKGVLTGLALLSFVATGELPDSNIVGRNIASAVDWILKNRADDVGILGMEREVSKDWVIGHGICTAALCEYYDMTKDVKVLPVVRQALAIIVRGQGVGGGWGYDYDQAAADLSVTAWQVLALHSARQAKVDAPGLEQALAKVPPFLAALKGPKGGYGRTRADDDYAVTGTGIVASLFSTVERGALRNGMQWSLDESEKRRPIKGVHADLEAWCFQTQASLLFGGYAWLKWERVFLADLITAQSADGSWPVPGGKHEGMQGDPGKSGQIYRTALCVLSLECYFRNLAIWH